MDSILSTSVAASNAGPNESRTRITCGRRLFDHLSRTTRALTGFGVYGFRWIAPWFAYAVSPLLNRLALGRTVHFQGFNVRLGECDLYTFANVFTDYPVAELSTALRDVQVVVDLGANAGSFLFLIQKLSEKIGYRPRLVALEPAAENAAFLCQQPFAQEVKIYQAAAGPSDGTGRLVRGQNSVTHHVDFSAGVPAERVQLVSLKSLCQEPALVKMDIEGGELAILQHTLPENVRHLIVEWHHAGRPSDFLSGKWKRISEDIHGATTWHFCR